jgi:hypothetical protein
MEWVILGVALVPVTDIFVVAKAAALVAVKVSVLVPDPAIDVGLKAAVTPVGKPPAESVTVPENPPDAVTVIVLVAVPPCCTLTVSGLAEIVKSGLLLTTFTEIVTVWVIAGELLLPVTVRVVWPTVAVAEALTVTVLPLRVAVIPELVAGGVKLKDTAPVNPPRSVTAIVLVAAAPPWVTDTLAGVAAREKSGFATVRVMGMLTV